MAEKRTIDININTNADEAAKEFDNVAKAENVANDSLEGLNKTFEEANGDIQPLTARMGEAEDRLYELAAAGDTASAEYQGLLNKVGEYRKVQISTDLAVDQAAGTLGQKLGGALTGAASGFAAVQGVMALTGSESEALEKSLLKVQGAMAFQQGIQGVLDYSKSIGLASKVQKAFNLILNANPLALLVTALIAVIGYFAIFTDGIDIAIQALKDFGDSIGLTNFEEDKLAAEQKKRNVEQMQRLKAEQTLRDAEIAQLEALGKSTIKLRRQRIESSIAAITLQKELNDLTSEFGNSLRRELGLEEEKVKQSEASIRRQALLVGLQTQLIELDKEQAAVNKTNSDNKAEQDKKAIDDAKELARILKEAIDTEIDEEIALQQTLDEIQRENEDRFRTEQENELLLVEEKYDALEAMAQGNAEALEQIEIARLNELNDINLEYGDIEYQNELEAAARLKEINDKEIQDSIDGEEKKRLAKLKGIDDGLNYAKQGADAVQQLGDLVFANKMSKLEKGSKEEEELARKQFKFNKALQLGGAIIDAGKAITASLAAAPIAIGPVPNPAGIASLAFAATSSAVNIAKIASTKFESPGGSPDAPTPNIGGGGAPNFYVVGDSGVNQLATLQQQPTQAYVVSGDVTTAQALDRNRVQNATL
jgi:hypothetical protein